MLRLAPAQPRTPTTPTPTQISSYSRLDVSTLTATPTLTPTATLTLTAQGRYSDVSEPSVTLRHHNLRMRLADAGQMPGRVQTQRVIEVVEGDVRPLLRIHLWQELGLGLGWSSGWGWGWGWGGVRAGAGAGAGAGVGVGLELGLGLGSGARVGSLGGSVLRRKSRQAPPSGPPGLGLIGLGRGWG